MKIVFMFDPYKSEKLRGIVADPVAFSLWSLWKMRHITSDYYEAAVLEVAANVHRTKPTNLENLAACFPSLSHEFPVRDVAVFVYDWLAFVLGEDTVEVEISEGKGTAKG